MWIKILFIGTLVVSVTLSTMGCIVMYRAFTIPGYHDLKQKQQRQSDADKNQYLDAILLEKINYHSTVLLAAKINESLAKYDRHGVELMNTYIAHLKEAKPSARLTGSTEKNALDKYETPNMTTVTSWNTGRKLFSRNGYMRYGMQYQNGRLIVPVAGRYFIHSYLELYESCNKTIGTVSKKAIKHSLFKFNFLDSTETLITEKIYSHKISSNGEFVYYGSYISVDVYLNAADEVAVKVSDIALLKYPDENCFGVHLL